jgi:Flp pilus assembly protein TadD
VEPQAVIAQVHERMGNWEGAKSAYREILRVQPQNPMACYSLANVIAQHGSDAELPEALRLARTAKDLVPRDARVLDTLGLVHLRRNEKTLAISEFQAALRQQPNNPEIKQHLAAAHRN